MPITPVLPDTPTSLLDLPLLAHRTGVRRVWVKAENERPLGNFKVLGGMTAGLRALEARPDTERLICASDGNHGLAVAAAAKLGGGKARIYLPNAVARRRARRIEAQGGEIVWIDGTYDEAVAAAADAAGRGEGLLIPDTTSEAADPMVAEVMDGYGRICQELAGQLRATPSHAFVQAGVGGLAAALAEGLPRACAIQVVEPEAAACVAAGLAHGRPLRIAGPLETCADMLSCGEASAPALRTLLRLGARSVLASEEELLAAVGVLQESGGPATTASGAAGLAGLLRVAGSPALREVHGLSETSDVVLIVTERALSS